MVVAEDIFVISSLRVMYKYKWIPKLTVVFLDKQDAGYFRSHKKMQSSFFTTSQRGKSFTYVYFYVRSMNGLSETRPPFCSQPTNRRFASTTKRHNKKQSIDTYLSIYLFRHTIRPLQYSTGVWVFVCISLGICVTNFGLKNRVILSSITG